MSKNNFDQEFIRKCAECYSLIDGNEINLSWEMLEYCNIECLHKYQKILGSQCANCKESVPQRSLGKYCIRFGFNCRQFCRINCFQEFKKRFVNCNYCQKEFLRMKEEFRAPDGDKEQFKYFCTQSCEDMYMQKSNQQATPVVVNYCIVCNKEIDVSVEVIHNKIVNNLCSELCFATFKTLHKIVAEKCLLCKKYFSRNGVNNYIFYSNGIVHCFCYKICMITYILENRETVSCRMCKVKKYYHDMVKKCQYNSRVLLFCSLTCMALYNRTMIKRRHAREKCGSCNTLSKAQFTVAVSDGIQQNFCTLECVKQFHCQYSKVGDVISESTPAPSLVPNKYLPQQVMLTQKYGKEIGTPYPSLNGKASNRKDASNASSIITRSKSGKV